MIPVSDSTRAARLPRGLIDLYLLWLAVWAPIYFAEYGWDNFLWLCDLANFIIGLALIFESRLLLSSQAVGVLVVQIVWTLDVVVRFFFGRHLVGGTEYMFDPAIPLLLRSFSLFHVFVPLILVYGLWRLGYDRRGLWLQTAITCVALTLAFFFTDPAENINWVRKPFGLEQRLVPPLVWMLACWALYPLALYYPTHRVLARVFKSQSGGEGPNNPPKPDSPLTRSRFAGAEESPTMNRQPPSQSGSPLPVDDGERG